MSYSHLPSRLLRYPLHLLGVYADTGQFIQVFMPKSEGPVSPNLAHHPAHAGTVGCPFDIKRMVFRAAAGFTLLIVIIRPVHRNREDRKHFLVPILDKLIFMAFIAGDSPAPVITAVPVYEFLYHN